MCGSSCATSIMFILLLLRILNIFKCFHVSMLLIRSGIKLFSQCLILIRVHIYFIIMERLFTHIRSLKSSSQPYFKTRMILLLILTSHNSTAGTKHKLSMIRVRTLKCLPKGCKFSLLAILSFFFLPYSRYFIKQCVGLLDVPYV